jgi:hypothetical protein
MHFCLLVLELSRSLYILRQIRIGNAIMPENRSIQVNLRLQPALKAAAEQAAASDHRSLTSLIEKLLADYLRTQPTLEDWHERAQVRFASAASDKNHNYQQFGTLTRSYSVRTANSEQINPAVLRRTLREIHDELRNPAIAWRIFYPFHNRLELIPYFTSDTTLWRGKTEEILEMVAFPPLLSRFEFWRVSPTGLATDISSHFEDDDREDHRQMGLHPGKWFYPSYMTRQITQLVLHASKLSQRFPSAESVEFCCQWSGLLEREISDLDLIGYNSGKIAWVDERVTTGEWPISQLHEGWPEIVSKLGGPVFRLFDDEFDYSPNTINTHLLGLSKR